MLAINKCDYQLSSGDVISIGMNFKALENMTRYPGGLGKLQKDMQRIAINNPEKEGYISLYNAPTTIDSYYKARVQHDMPELAN